MITERKPNYQALLRMVDLAEKHEVNMSTWLCHIDENDFSIDSEPIQISFDGKDSDEQEEEVTLLKDNFEFCNTVGCLAGTYTVAYPESLNVVTLNEVIELWDGVGRTAPEELLEHLGISAREFNWLFLWERIYTCFHMTGSDNSIPTYTNLEKCHILDEIRSDKAVKRLRRFIYHKLKQEEIHEAWNSRYNTKHSQSENTNYVSSMAETACAK